MLTRIFTLFGFALLAACTSAFTVAPSVNLSVSSRSTSTAGNPLKFTSSINSLKSSESTSLRMSTNDEKTESKLPMLLDPGTKGGAIFLSLVLFIVPIIGYEIATIGFGLDGIDVGRWIGVGFTFFTTVLWVGTYIFRVATKDMTYAKQLKDYENQVIAKRLEELDEDEIQALVEDIERDDF
uniref:Uncharacterized protein n=1 Tax=Chaetoceros debilis TaxID=122233 RepID=A0A7S3QA31_9STRA|mmetsp:Transcript_5600/g.8297  ORF Transcript_5600/g.8297 Transcript_5600/m.8297 type:complete len:182 (-) Transcript_5600:326-871(-)